MQYTQVESPAHKAISLVAHDNMKAELIKWCAQYKQELCQHTLYATGTTGLHIEKHTGLKVNKLISGPLGGDQQIGALITEQKIDVMIFFWDPLEAQPHDPDVKALLRLAAVWNIPVACNRASADMLVTSPLFAQQYSKTIPDYASYIQARSE